MPMALDHNQAHVASAPTRWPCQLRRRAPFLRRRKVQTVRLGGRKKPRRRLLGLVRMFRRIRLRWLKLQYLRVLRRLKKHYRNVLKDLVEAGATIETFHQRLFMESTFAVPLGVSMSSYPSHFGSDRPRTIFM